MKNAYDKIVQKCLVLRELNLRNKVLINKNFYLNQYFLDLFSSHTKDVTYNIDGNLEI